MKTEKFIVENISCNACANSIKNSMSTLKGVEKVDVDVAKGVVTITHENIPHYVISIKLDDIGYPEVINKQTVKSKSK